MADEAELACHHPLLLRFFCEAYGSVEGTEVTLGEVRDIRLKELFDVYLSRKTEQIRRLLNHRNRDGVSRYLFSLVTFVFRSRNTVILTTEIEEATGDADTSTEQSLYLHLLDEDIIIEEQPGDDLDSRRISFVYEEFMEYLLAKSLLRMPKMLGLSNVKDVFALLETALEQWVNARGVGEYIGLMLLANDYSYSRQDAVDFLRLMARKGGIWCDAFWSVIGKCSENHLGPDVFDEFFYAINALSNMGTIKKTLDAMSRYSQEGCNRLASVLLWSAALPRVLSWTELEALPGLNDSELRALSDRLTSALAHKKFSAPPGKMSYKSLFATIVPFLNADAQRVISKATRLQGEPGMERVSDRGLLRLFWRAFPEHSPLLLNGLFSESEDARRFCADRLRFAKHCPREVAFLCEALATVEDDLEISRLLRDSASHLNQQASSRTRQSAR